MARVLVLLLVYVALAAVAESNPISDALAKPSPCLNCDADKTRLRPKRHLEYFIQGAAQVWSNLFGYGWEHSRSNRHRHHHHKSTYIGNGHHNINNVHFYGNNGGNPEYTYIGHGHDNANYVYYHNRAKNSHEYFNSHEDS